jgi:uncharacterized protein DUF5926/SEC-C motif-containing protein
VGRRSRDRRSSTPAGDGGAAESSRRPCPCGSGKRYRNCHGSGAGDDVLITRPFEGLAGEGDWIALRELVPSATAPLHLADDPDRKITLATVLPLALPALVRDDGSILLGLQVHGRSNDVSRDLAHALTEALAAEPGQMVQVAGLPGPGPRLQDLLAEEPLALSVHDDFSFWLEEGTEQTADVAASLERANASIIPTVRLSGVDAAYWCNVGEKAHLRWVMPYEEDPLLDALARLAAAGTLGLGENTRYAGSFRAHGRLVPVWDLPVEDAADAWERPAAAFADRLAKALTDDGPLTDEQRRARNGLRGRQLTLR